MITWGKFQNLRRKQNREMKRERGRKSQIEGQGSPIRFIITEDGGGGLREQKFVRRKKNYFPRNNHWKEYQSKFQVSV